MPQFGPERGGEGRAAGPEHGDDAEGRGGAAGPSEAAARRGGAAAARAELVAGANARGAELGRGRRAQITWGRGQSSPLPWAEWGREGWLSL